MMLRYSMQPIRNMTRLKNQPVAPISSTPPSEAPSTATECVATAAISQAPLMPAAIDGLVDRNMTAVKKAYITKTRSEEARGGKEWVSKRWTRGTRYI